MTDVCHCDLDEVKLYVILSFVFTNVRFFLCRTCCSSIFCNFSTNVIILNESFQTCACPQFDAYAQKCIELGVDLNDWREEVEFCRKFRLVNFIISKVKTEAFQIQFGNY